jgi:hypothetical protein
MIKVWDLTIYELLGYFVPGVLTFSGLFLFATLEQPTWLARSYWPSLGWWVALPLVASYVLGHVVQASANAVFGRFEFEAHAIDDVLKEIPASGFEAVARRLSMPDPAADDPRLKASPRHFLTVCTEILEQEGKPASRDVFLYREGFYRGTCIALLVLAAGLTAYGLLQAKPGETVTPRGGAVLCALGALGFFVRYRRFLRYRVSACLWGSVTIATSTKAAASR